MKTRVIISFIVFFGIAMFLIAASKEDGLGAYAPDPMQLEIPKGWPKPSTDIYQNNKLTVQGFQLGKKLFYDGRLSSDGEISCASCHQQFAAFASFDHDLSHGVNNSFSTRNAPGLFNLAWMTSMHWDGSINHIEVQPLAPITAKNEMGETLENVLQKLKADTAYKRMFKTAFGDPVINSQRMLKAIAQFTGTLVSANSKYDRVKRGEDVFTSFEEKGYMLFKQKCADCHKEPLFTDNSFRNNGLPLNRYSDIGRQAITLLPEDSLKFKVPSLRNAQLTFPYMHDGRIYSIPQVIEHYMNGIKIDQPTLDPLLKNRIQLTNLEKNQLVYFIYTLTDSSFTKNPKFSPEGKSEITNPGFDSH